MIVQRLRGFGSGFLTAPERGVFCIARLYAQEKNKPLQCPENASTPGSQKTCRIPQQAGPTLSTDDHVGYSQHFLRSLMDMASLLGNIRGSIPKYKRGREGAVYPPSMVSF